MKKLPAGFVVRETYTIVRYLGSGAFGDVYLARHRYMGLQALKIFQLVKGSDLLQEAFILTRIGHPNIIRVFEANDFVWENETYQYFSMEYIRGGTLADYLERKPHISVRFTLCAQIAAGLAVAHSEQPPIIHRDLTPWNILVAVENEKPLAKITDFGLAKEIDITTRLASAAGNFFYMPPEAFWGYESPASDVYSVGIIFYELLTGHTPFPVQVPPSATEKERATLVRNSRRHDPPRSSMLNSALDSRWDQFFERILAFDAGSRVASGSELQSELKCLADSQLSAGISKDEVEKMVADALAASRQYVSLQVAIELLEKACQVDEDTKRQYSETLEMWKRGVVQ